jgi:hypothetical protein
MEAPGSTAIAPDGQDALWIPTVVGATSENHVANAASPSTQTANAESNVGRSHTFLCDAIIHLCCHRFKRDRPSQFRLRADRYKNIFVLYRTIGRDVECHIHHDRHCIASAFLVVILRTGALVDALAALPASGYKLKRTEDWIGWSIYCVSTPKDIDEFASFLLADSPMVEPFMHTQCRHDGGRRVPTGAVVASATA